MRPDCQGCGLAAIQAGSGLESYFNDYDVGCRFLVNNPHQVREVFFSAYML